MQMSLELNVIMYDVFYWLFLIKSSVKNSVFQYISD